MTSFPDPLDLSAIEARWKASTPGIWRLDNSDGDLWWDDRTRRHIGPEERARRGISVVRHWHVWGPTASIQSSGNDAYFVPDMDFIANAHQDIPALLAEVHRLRRVAGEA